MNESPLTLRCRTAEQARRLAGLLLEAGVAGARIEVLSAEPVHGLPPTLTRSSRLPWLVVAGAVTGALLGTAMAAVTARLYPLTTGGMPLVAPLPVGIVAYESMMLLAILFTLAGLLAESRLLRRRPADDAEVAEAIAAGEIHVLAHPSSAEERARLEKLLQRFAQHR